MSQGEFVIQCCTHKSDSHWTLTSQNEHSFTHSGEVLLEFQSSNKICDQVFLNGKRYKEKGHIKQLTVFFFFFCYDFFTDISLVDQQCECFQDMIKFYRGDLTNWIAKICREINELCIENDIEGIGSNYYMINRRIETC